jgi:HEAT repeat protein
MHSWEGDPRPEPTPQYGDIQPGPSFKQDQSIDPQAASWRVLFAVAVGILLAGFFVTGNARAAFEQVTKFLTLQGRPEPASPAVLSEHEIENLDSQAPQAQAELLLERAINHYAGANDQIATRVARWWGKLKLTPRFNALITTALNSDDLRVRAAGIEVDLVAMGAVKTPVTVERLALQVVSGPSSQRVWALWELGLLGNRGVEPERVSEILIGQLHDSDPEVRHWAVEGLAYLGTNETIAPLLQAFHDDPSPMVRERAGCSLAQSGMLTQEQRHSVIPHLLDYADDSSLDAQTHTWVYQALRDITGKNLPNDSSAWRNWYSATGGWKESG